MSFQKQLMLRLAVDNLGVTSEETRMANPTDHTDTQLAAIAQTPAAIPLGQRMGVALRFWLKTILPFFLWTDQSR